MKTYHYIVHGIVQGVAFRYYTIKSAQKNAIRGTVKNLSNGNVEVYAQGTPQNIKKFESFLRNGPPAAVVQNVSKKTVEVKANPDQLFHDFEIIY